MKNQRGNILVLIAIIVTTALVVGILGFLLYQNFFVKKGPNELLKTSSQNINDPEKAENDLEGYLVIKEWSVKIKTSVNSDLSYSISSRIGGQQNVEYDSLNLKIKPTSVTDQNCVEFGADLMRQREEPSFSYVKIDEYYYFVTGAPGQCSENQSDFDLQRRVLDELKPSNVSKLND